MRGDGSLATFPALTGFVPYTGATADVNLGTHDLAAERGTFANNGSSDTLTVNHTSGSGYGIIVTKGGANEALYVSKTSGSGNAMTVVGGRTSLVDLALSSVTNTAGDFLTLSGGVVHKRTAAQTLTDIGGQAALTNPVTGTGTTNYLPKFTGSTTIGNSQVFDNGTLLGINTNSIDNTILTVFDNRANGDALKLDTVSTKSDLWFSNSTSTNGAVRIRGESNGLSFITGSSIKTIITSSGRMLIGNPPPTESTFQLDVNGTGRFSGALTSLITANAILSATADSTSRKFITIANNGSNLNIGIENSAGGDLANGTSAYAAVIASTRTDRQLQFATENTVRFTLASTGNVLIGTTTDGASKLRIVGLPTSAAGLSSGDVYNLAGVLMIA
jgi:hypothetical protein